MPAIRPPHAIESAAKFAADSLGHNVAGNFSLDAVDGGSLYEPNGERKYLNHAERCRVISIASSLDPERALFALLLAWTGARVSEVLALTPSSFQVEAGVVTIMTLKRRKFCPREVPIPPALMKRIGLYLADDGRDQSSRLWPWHRATAWRLVKSVMQLAKVNGRRACPRGLRHAFGVETLRSKVPINLIQRWMGHARLKTTMIYTSVAGPEEHEFARQFWRASGTR